MAMVYWRLRAEVAELADAPALGAGGRKAVGVRVPSSADFLLFIGVPSDFIDFVGF
jgi:hypothetical protein